MKRVVLWSQLSVLFMAFLPACGSDGGGSGGAPADVISSCVNWCNKEVSCDTTGEVKSVVFQNEDCTTYCNNEAKNESSSCDYAKLKTQLDTCAADTCADLNTCTEQIGSICPMPQGSGGAANNGSGGSTAAGSGGLNSSSGGSETASGGAGTGAADCSICAKAATCCASIAQLAGQPTTSCSSYSESTCNTQPSTYITLCTDIVNGGAAQNLSGCK